MRKLFTTLFLLIIPCICSEKLAFVFETVRHGARAALKETKGVFNVAPGILTP